MNKTELIEKVAKKTGMTLKDSREAVDAIFSTSPKEGIIANEMAAGRRVQITGFGTFRKKSRPARMGRNPRTGESIRIEPRDAVSFKPSRHF